MLTCSNYLIAALPLTNYTPKAKPDKQRDPTALDSMASNALHLFPCRIPTTLRGNLTSCFSINPSRMTRSRLAFNTRRHTMSCSSENGENQSQPLEEESVSLKHFIEQAKDLVTSDAGQPHWFSPSDCGHPLPDPPLPGIDGTGLGLIMHHQKLGDYVLT
uniref:uncharacterized protein LOC105350621 n=1 Tax=Fragaria vesca subsp. vesca TaxID=101020 RepID=UPI0005CA2FA6|nr:PREDICTED: uncharacterized protein LOC105350621 [Fragaria vesca subsp. vesca]